jgi:hypothetical protein
VEYTYVWEEPAYTTYDLVTKNFDDFSITYPSDWDVYFENYREDDQIFYKIRVPSEEGNTSGLTIRYVAERHKLTEYNQESFAVVAEQTGENLGTTVTCDQFAYGKLYGTGMAFSFMSGEYNGDSIEWILQYVPTGSGLYVFTYKIVNGEGREDLIAAANSVQFR